MAQFIILTTNKNDVPALGETTAAMCYRGDHADEATAVKAAADALGLGNGDRLWAVSAGAATRYTNTTSVSRNVAAG